MNPARVLVVSADPLARAGLAGLLAQSDLVTVAGLASDRDDLPAALDAYRPDVLLWDLGWDAGGRVEALASAAETAPPVVALLAQGGDAAAVWAAGVRGLLERDTAADALAAGLLAAASGVAVFSPPPRDTTAQAPFGRSSGLEAAPVEALTPREMEVLHALADGLSNKLIARDLAISEHTVKFHVNSILAKLDAQSRTDAVVRATRAGLLHL